jgi:hypothetical protein
VNINTGLTPGEEYVLTGSLMDKQTGEPILKYILSITFEQKSHSFLSSSRAEPEHDYLAPPSMSACLTRQDSPRNCRSLPWWTTRSITAAAIWSSPKTAPPARELEVGREHHRLPLVGLRHDLVLTLI